MNIHCCIPRKCVGEGRRGGRGLHEYSLLHTKEGWWEGEERRGDLHEYSLLHTKEGRRPVATGQANHCLGPRATLGPQTTIGYGLNATTNNVSAL